VSGCAIPYTVVVPVGPADEELGRLQDLLASLATFAGPARPKLVLIDDAPEPRALERAWDGATVVRTALWDGPPPPALDAMVAGTLEAMTQAQGAFALKLDTDALVIAPFEAAIAAAFAADPTVGVLGAYDRSPDGGARDFSMWPRPLRRTAWPVVLGPGPRIARRPQALRARARAVLIAARRARGYRLGAHCLGGAYAVAPRLLAHAADWDWRAWIHDGLSEDVVLGLHCAAHGLRMQGLVDRGEPFGVAWQGLPFAPEELVARGHSIVHSVKDGAHGREAELRARFRALAGR
jgi:hypothetical protein